MSSGKSNSRRPHGTGSLYLRTDRAGRETWYAHWRTRGRQVKRRIGPKRSEGARDGLTRRQAEAELRRLISETAVAPAAAERLTIAEIGARYMRHMEMMGRKTSTIAA